MADAFGLFQDPRLVRQAIENERKQNQIAQAQAFGSSSGGFMGGAAIGNALRGLFGGDRAGSDPRMQRALKLQGVKRKVASRLGTGFDPKNESQLSIIKDELVNAGLVNEAVQVAGMMAERMKTQAEVADKAAGAAKKSTEAKFKQAELDAGLPQATVDEKRASASRQREEAKTESSRRNLNNANAFYISNLGKGALLKPVTEDEQIDTISWLDSQVDNFSSFLPWKGMNSATQSAIATDLSTLSKSLMVRGEAKNLQEARVKAMAQLEPFLDGNKYKVFDARNHVMELSTTLPTTTPTPGIGASAFTPD